MAPPKASRAPLARSPLSPGAQPPIPRLALLALDSAPEEGAEASEEEIELAKAAAQDCAFVVMGFFHVTNDQLFKATRGSAKQAFARQVLMAGLNMALGFSRATAGAAMGRTKDTADHACRIIDGIRGAMPTEELIELIGEDDAETFLGGDGIEEFLEHAEPIIERMFAAFVLVAVDGRAWRSCIARMQKDHQANRGR